MFGQPIWQWQVAKVVDRLWNVDIRAKAIDNNVGLEADLLTFQGGSYFVVADMASTRICVNLWPAAVSAVPGAQDEPSLGGGPSDTRPSARKPKIELCTSNHQ